MKPFFLALLATVSLVAADPAPTPAPEPLTAVPRYSVPPAALARPGLPGVANESPADPNVLELPKMTVVKPKPRPRARLGDTAILGPTAFNEDLAKKNLSALDRGLNKFTLPLFGTSAADRAREDYNIAQKEQFMSDVLTIAKATELTDPEAAKALREAAAKP
jgi:hypothetical protein